MYRIRLTSGEEKVFWSLDELAGAVSSGLLSPDAQIYHGTSGQWLPVSSHPHFRAAVDLRSTPDSIPEPKPKLQSELEFLKELERIPDSPKSVRETGEQGPRPTPNKLVIKRPGAEMHRAVEDQISEDATQGQAAQEAVEPVIGTKSDVPGLVIDVPELAQMTEPALVAEPAPPQEEIRVATDVSETPPVVPTSPIDQASAEPAADYTAPSEAVEEPISAASVQRRTRRRHLPTRRALAGGLALGIGAVLLFAWGVWQVRSRRLPELLSNGRRGPVQQAVAIGEPGGKLAVSTTGPSANTDSFSVADSLARSPLLPFPVVSPARLTNNYAAQYAQARRDLDASLRSIHFDRLFAPARLNSVDSLRAGRKTIAAAMDLVRVYRRRQAGIEEAYRDSVKLLAERLGWTSREVAAWEWRVKLGESHQVGRMADSLLVAVDSAYGLLLSPAPRSTNAQGSIAFKDARVGRGYAELRLWLTQRINSWADSSERALPVTVGKILAAIGTTRLPEGGPAAK